MQNTKYFNVKSFNEYLRGNIKGASLKIVPRGKSSEDVFVQSPYERSFEFIDSDFLENQPVTQGHYIGKEGIKGYWEEFRVRFKTPVHFQEKQAIPRGKYKIRVTAEGNKPVVRTFVRKSILGIVNWWEKNNLPSSLPLTKILNGNLEDYTINPE